tara:strand:- start:1860 stop:2057 length:198 start_codon:yes stop_codon:yes gene_type:complete
MAARSNTYMVGRCVSMNPLAVNLMKLEDDVKEIEKAIYILKVNQRMIMLEMEKLNALIITGENNG